MAKKKLKKDDMVLVLTENLKADNKHLSHSVVIDKITSVTGAKVKLDKYPLENFDTDGKHANRTNTRLLKLSPVMSNRLFAKNLLKDTTLITAIDIDDRLVKAIEDELALEV